jgi:ABC-type multidrug transport system ATPase subunit
MACLVVTIGPDEGLKAELETGIIQIGRDASTCSLVLSDPRVSRVHARVRLLPDGRAIVEDCGSRNGIFCKGDKIGRTVKINPGDEIIIGDCHIKYENFDQPQKPVRINPISQADDAFHIAGGYTRSLYLSQGTITIGRDPTNDFVLDHPMVSRFHARIVSLENKYLIYDLASTNGTYVNGSRVADHVELFPSNTIQICGYRFLFDGQTLIEFDETSGQVRIEVNQLRKEVNLPDGNKRLLLDNISLVIEPREFVAILGGSGTGKTTLMSALTAMNPATSGRVTVNGRDLYKEYNSFRSMIGYVPQDDIVHMDLTVREVLTYSARLRMPDDVTEDEIRTSVETVLSDLELTLQQNLPVKNLSGGQRKRVSIGVELLTRPSLFFLDEPTSGLDPGLEKIMMELLRKLADQGRVIVLVTHATFNISLCDKVVFLTGGGQLAFLGSPQDALAYFGVKDFAEIYKKIATEKTPEQWASLFVNSPVFHKNIGSKISGPDLSDLHNKNNEIDIGRSDIKTSSLKQWWVLTNRYARIVSKDRKNIMILVLQAVVIASMIVMVYVNNAPLFHSSSFQAEDLEISQQVFITGQYDQVQENIQFENKRRAGMKISVALMVFTSIWLGTSNSAREIIKELPVYRRERLIKLRIAPYLFSKMTVQSLICFVQTVILVTIVTLGLGLPQFGLNLAAFFAISFASMVMGLTVSAAATNMDKALSAVQLLLIPQIILSGAIIPMNEVKPELFQKVFYLAISKWGYELVGGGICSINEKVADLKPLPELSGSFAGHWLALVGFMVLLYFITTLALLKKDSQQLK